MTYTDADLDEQRLEYDGLTREEWFAREAQRERSLPPGQSGDWTDKIPTPVLLVGGGIILGTFWTFIFSALGMGT